MTEWYYDKSHVIGELTKMGSDSRTKYPVLQAKSISNLRQALFGIPPGFSTLWWCLRCLRFGICHLLLKELEFGTPGVKIGPREHEKKIRSTGPSFAQISYLRDRDRCGPEHFFVKYWEIVNSEGTFIPEASAVLALRVQIEEILKFRAKMS